MCLRSQACHAISTAYPTGRVLAAQGLGKRVMASDFPMQRRGGKGIFAIKLKDGDSLVDFHLVGSDAGGGLST